MTRWHTKNQGELKHLSIENHSLVSIHFQIITQKTSIYMKYKYKGYLNKRRSLKNITFQLPGSWWIWLESCVQLARGVYFKNPLYLKIRQISFSQVPDHEKKRREHQAMPAYRWQFIYIFKTLPQWQFIYIYSKLSHETMFSDNVHLYYLWQVKKQIHCCSIIPDQYFVFQSM